jgi:CRP-like cAMP-binding protein
VAGDERPVGVERLLFLRSLSTARLEGPEASQIAAAMRDVYFKRGQVLFSIGDASGEIYFVVKGSVQMTAPGTAPWDFEAPAIVGVLDSFAGRRRERRGVATSDVHALALAHTDWLAVLEEHHDYACESVIRLATVLARMRLGIPGDGGYPAPSPTEGALPARLGLFERTLALRRLPIFHDAGVEATLRLCQHCEEIRLGPGEELFREGDPGEGLDVVAGGLVDVQRADPPLSAAFGPGALVGGAASLAPGARSFGARAREGAVVLRVHKDDVFDAMEDHFALTRSLLTAINAEREELMRKHGTAGAEVPPPSSGTPGRAAPR